MNNDTDLPAAADVSGNIAILRRTLKLIDGLQRDGNAPEVAQALINATLPSAMTGYAATDNSAALAIRVNQLRFERHARRKLDAEENPPTEIPAAPTLPALLAAPPDPVRFRIDGLMPVDGRALLSARRKLGKTIMVGNLIRTLVDGAPFLGRFPVHGAPRRVALIDAELSQAMLRTWLAEQAITNTEAVVAVANLRGRTGAFDILDTGRRTEWAALLSDAGADFLIFDPMRPVLDSLGLDENREAGKFLTAFDALLYEAHIAEGVIVHHMGHGHERARGDSRLEDWPDAIWRIVPEDADNPASARYFSATGRDVDIPEGRLAYDPATRCLSYEQGSRRDAQAEAALPDVVQVLAEAGEALSGRAVEDRCADQPRAAVRAALKLAVGRDVIARCNGAKRSHLHSIAHPCAECGLPVTSGRGRHESCPPSAEGSLF
jgi:hypothetical protein